jgi:hypothetical protein
LKHDGKYFNPMHNYKLTIELVPQSSWYDNVRSKVSKQVWDVIRRKCYHEAGYKCQICGNTGKNQGVKHDVDCHEIWQYDDDCRVQKLIGFIALCPNCHLVKHPGFAQIQGKSDQVITQLMLINDITFAQATDYVADAFEIWMDRNQFKWEIDITYIDEYMKQPKEPEEPTIF